MTKQRLDHLLVAQGLVRSRSQAESYIRLGRVMVDGKVAAKPGQFVHVEAKVAVQGEQYVSRAAHKLASVADKFHLSFKDKVILDVGASTGGFTDYALQHGALTSIAVDVGTNQLHPHLRADSRVESHEQTDIRDIHSLSTPVDIVVIDVSFVSLRHILPPVATLVSPRTQIVAMCKPQFESGNDLKHKGVVKNDKIRREILKEFELWLRKYFVIEEKADSEVAGEKGNVERFYLLNKITH